MNRLLAIISMVFFFYACSSSKVNSSSGILKAAVKALSKAPDDKELQNEVIHLYETSLSKHLSNIEMYDTLTEADKWEKILKEYGEIQKLMNVITSSAAARKLVNTQSYEGKIAVVKEQAAGEYFEIAEDLLAEDEVTSARKAYDLYEKVNKYVPGYRDVAQKMKIARERGILDVVINPITDQTVFYRNMGPNRFGNSFNNDFLQTALVRDLGGDFSRNSFARFYTDWEAKRANIEVDWIVDIMWTELHVPVPYSQQYSKNLSRQIQVGKDTSGKPVFETVTGTLYITRQYFSARGELECRITDAVTRLNVNLNRYSSSFNWEQQYATYRGDARALTDEDRMLINNTNFSVPGREAVLDELFRKIYPQVKSNIEYLVRRE